MNSDEKLARAIDALVLVSGQPELDEEHQKYTGEDRRDNLTIKVARKALAAVGYVFVGPPVAQRWDN